MKGELTTILIKLKETILKGQKKIWQRPTFPPPYKGSIIGAGDLNFRVRNGNGCILTAMVTRNLYRGSLTPE